MNEDKARISGETPRSPVVEQVLPTLKPEAAAAMEAKKKGEDRFHPAVYIMSVLKSIWSPLSPH